MGKGGGGGGGVTPHPFILQKFVFIVKVEDFVPGVKT